MTYELPDNIMGNESFVEFQIPGMIDKTINDSLACVYLTCFSFSNSFVRGVDVTISMIDICLEKCGLQIFNSTIRKYKLFSSVVWYA